MKIHEYFKIKDGIKKISSIEEYDLFCASIEFDWDIFFNITSDFKFSFSTRENNLYLGIGHLKVFDQSQKNNHTPGTINDFAKEHTLDSAFKINSSFFKLFESLPEEIFYFYQQTFYKDKQTIILPEIQIIKSKESCEIYFFQRQGAKIELQTFNENSSSRNILLQETHEPDEYEWRNIFKSSRMFLLENPKIVLTRKTQFRFKNRVPINKLFLNLFKEGFYNYFVQTKYHYFLGSSPERLLKFQNNSFYTEALAGTKAIEQKEELLSSTKDLKEQKIVLDEILQSIEPLVDDIQTSPTYLFEYKNLAHLKTDIVAKPQSTDIFAWINAIHPTPAVCGLPRDKSFEFLRTHEPYKRENYCGSLGIIQRNHMDITVALRCAEVYRNLVTAYVGVGVVADSSLESEWQELDLKLENMRKALEI